MKAALSAEEWAGYRGRSVIVDGRVFSVEPETAHGNAAACLHGQEFGFTREGADVLRGIAVSIEEVCEWVSKLDASRRVSEGRREDATADIERLCSIAARIEALLPPETK